jgi:hypothetical protein
MRARASSSVITASQTPRLAAAYVTPFVVDDSLFVVVTLRRTADLGFSPPGRANGSRRVTIATEFMLVRTCMADERRRSSVAERAL